MMTWRRDSPRHMQPWGSQTKFETCPTMHHFVTEMCIVVHSSITKMEHFGIGELGQFHTAMPVVFLFIGSVSAKPCCCNTSMAMDLTYQEKDLWDYSFYL